jgi:ribosomal protein S12 methylthiotransferase
VDTERVMARLAGAGADTRDADDADVIEINTCGYIDSAKEESVETILAAVRLKDAGRVRAVVAMGCLVQRYRKELEAELPEVDLFLGLTDVERLVPELRSRGLLAERDAVPTMERPLRLLSTDTPHTSYLKVSEGCDHTCAFCAIPLMRGKHRSTPLATLVREAAELSARGVVELNLISQDTTWYGRDLIRSGTDGTDGEFFIGKPFAGMPGIGEADLAAAAPGATTAGRDRTAGRAGLLPDLLRALLDDTDIPWFRLFYMYPSGIDSGLVELIAREPRILPYLDMPIQHGSDAVLTRMRRPERAATIRERVHWLRDAIPDLTLRTTVIAGFPGETEDDFDAMLDLLEEIRFDHVGAFTYSVEEGTRAAAMADQVPDAVRRERLERLQELQRSISLERNERWVGGETTVLIDRLVGRDMDAPPEDADPGRGAIGRTVGQALEVDGVVHIADAGSARAGDFVRVRIDEALDYDLAGEILFAEAGG